MRLHGLMLAILCSAFLNTTYTYAQAADAHPTEEQQLEPYHKHRDTRHGHDHSYPDRGSVIRDLPRGTIGVSYAGLSYRFHDGIWLEPRGPAFIVVAPPIGLVVPNLPSFTTVLAQGGQTFLYANNVYYRPRPDLGGYEVVNDPLDSTSQSAAETSFTGGQVPGGAVSAPQATSPQAPAPFAVLPAASVATTPTAVAPTPMPATSVASATPAGLAAPAIGGPAATMRLATPAAGPPVPPSPVTPSSAPSGEAPAATPSAPVLAAPVLASAPTVPVPNATVAPATGSAAISQSARGSKVFIYPKNGQNPDQQARDRYDCYRFAVAQSGLDPMHPGGAATPNAELQSDFDRAQGACFDARGYTTR